MTKEFIFLTEADIQGFDNGLEALELMDMNLQDAIEEAGRLEKELRRMLEDNTIDAPKFHDLLAILDQTKSHIQTAKARCQPLWRKVKDRHNEFRHREEIERGVNR